MLGWRHVKKLGFQNTLVLCVAAFVMLLQKDALLQRVNDWRDRRHFQSLLEVHWAELVRLGGRLGPADEDIVLIEFGDYQCPFYRDTHSLLDSVLDIDGAASVAYVHYPVTRIHEFADLAARGAVCADRQGRFAEYHARLFTRTDWSDEPDWAAEAELAGVPDVSGFRECMESDGVARQIARGLELAELLGVDATPAFLSIDGITRGMLVDSLLWQYTRRTRDVP